MIISLLALLACNLYAADLLDHNSLLLGLLAQQNSNLLPLNQGNQRSPQTITQAIQDKQAEIDTQWQECLCQATTVGAAGVIFGTALYPIALHVSVSKSLFLGAASSAPYCGMLLCINSYDHAKRKSELDDLIREYQQTLPSSREMSE